MSTMTTRAVFFDVDFTLIYPGPTFQGEGYQRFCAKHGMRVDAGAFTRAVAAASSLLEDAKGQRYDPQLFIDYTRRIIEEMGGSGPGLNACTREMYEEWAACQHFSLYGNRGIRELGNSAFGPHTSYILPPASQIVER